MSALHAALVAALDATQHDADTAIYRTARLGDKLRRQVAADRRVLARHAEMDHPVGPACAWCKRGLTTWPCPDVADLAARYDVEVPS